MLGLSAIALGNAVGALRAARGHAQDRHQGGKAIEQHGAVQQMLGASSVRVSMCAAALAEVARRDCDHPAATWRALAAKLQIGQDSVTVVSDCLQVFGACGVTQDCGLATRLRDALTVNSMVLAPNLLRRLCANAPFGGPR
jgi:alkylation response protein AidB-like acyl-CoA dehydrogenase